MLSPYLFLAKSLIQTLWRKRKHWDEPLDPEDLVVWEKWSVDLSSLQEFELPCWTSIDKPSDALFQLHLFGDASEKGFRRLLHQIHIPGRSDPHLICHRKEPSSPSEAVEHTQAGASSSPSRRVTRGHS